MENALQMKGRWESNINVWLLFMYSQKWNCAAHRVAPGGAAMSEQGITAIWSKN